MSRAPLGRGAENWCFFLLACCAASLGIAHPFAPLVDFPQHCLQAAIVSHAWDAWDPSSAWRAYVITDWFVPYQVTRILHAALLSALRADWAMRLILLVYLVGMPLAARSLGRRMGATPWAALGAFVVLVDANFLWGFLPHCVALIVLFLGLAQFIDLLEDGSVSAFARCVLLGVLLFFTHPIVTGVYLLSACTLTCTARWKGDVTLRTAASAVVALLPASLLLVFYLLSRGWVDGSVLADGRAVGTVGIAWGDPLTRVLKIGSSTGFALQGWLPAISYVMCLGALALLASFERKEPTPLSNIRKLTPYVFVAVWLACFLLLPDKVRGERIAPRFASLVAFGLLLLPWPSLRRVAPSLAFSRALQTIVVTCALVSLGVAHRSFYRFSAEMAPMAEILTRVPSGVKVASLIYDPLFRGTQLPAFVNVGAYITYERGGIASFMFTRLGIDYAASVPEKRLLLDPRRSATRGFHMPLSQVRFYDFVLVRLGGAYRGNPMAEPNDELRRVFAKGSFELWKRKRPR